jgi:hypothetical protein
MLTVERTHKVCFLTRTRARARARMKTEHKYFFIYQTRQIKIIKKHLIIIYILVLNTTVKLLENTLIA